MTEGKRAWLAHPGQRYRLRRNFSYWNSVRNGLLLGVWWLPFSAEMLFRCFVLPLLKQLARLVAGTAMLSFCHIAWLIAGLLGHLVEGDDEESQ